MIVSKTNLHELLFCTLSFVLCTLVGCIKLPQEQHTSYDTIQLTRQTVTAPLTWSAAIRGTGDVSIVSRCTGTLKEIKVKDGQSVKKGDILFLIDSRSAENALAHARADLQTAIANRDNAQLEADSNKELADQGIISDYLLRMSLNMLQSAEAQVSQAEAAVRDAELRLDYCTIKSPVDGLVGNIIPHVGDVIAEADMLTRIAGVKEMEASFSLTESQIHALVSEFGNLDKVIKIAPALTLRFKEGTEYTEKGHITSFSGLIDQRTGSITCYVTFPNPKGELFSGMQGTVVMPIEWENVILVPLTSIVRIQDKALVYKVGADSLATSAIVEIEDLGDGERAVILSGAEVGETIVAKGAANVHEKDKVIY
ncbi:MAG: efflux RND transporter periplasmic adaptor subunit [Paludibacteraceae bacterium]|nr:efflux RND transporter periplasmic adaptor subunit [Paludibacteraceae bacterium]